MTPSPPGGAWVVDASVIVKFVLPEELSDRAVGLLDGAFAEDWELRGPDLWRTEVANALWKRHRLRLIDGELVRELDAVTAADVFAWSVRLPVRTHSSAGLLATAFELALQTGLTVYDALYVALALREGAPLITADHRLIRRLDGHAIQDGVVHLAEL